jgi:thioredoxin-related protein
MIKKHVLVILSLVLMTLSLQAQETEKKESLIKWLDFETAVEKQKELPKPIFIDMYTDWCGWCKKLDSETFANPEIANYISTYFYPVKFDAETQDTIQYKGKDYVNSQTGRRATHDLALELLDNRASYPSMVYIDPNGQVSKTAGFMDAKKIEPILIFFAEHIHRTTNFEAFSKAFNFVFRDEEAPNLDMSGNVKWLSLDEALEKQKENPKKLLILFVSDYYQRVSSILIEDISFTNPHIADYVNEAFYPVRFQAASTDTIEIFDQTFVNEQRGVGYPHQFVFSLLQNNVVFPSIVFLNEKNELISPMQGYFIPQIMEPYFHFVATDEYKEGDWQEYYKNYKGKVPRKQTQQ